MPTLLLVLPLFAVAAQSESPLTVERLEGELAERVHRDLAGLAEDTGFSGAVIVAEQGAIVLDAGYGYADRGARTRFTTETVAQIGSLTKQFTAMAVIDLALEDKLDFGSHVGAYLPDAAEPGRSVSLAQLLTHTSGMAEYCGADFDKVARTDLLRDCMGRPLRFPPGSDNAYSNVGYSVLGAVVEAVSGRDLEGYLKEEILLPNDLKTVGYRPPQGAVLARGYLNDHDRGVISDRIATLDGDFWALKGNGGMQASTRDMFGWYEALAGRRALSDAHIETAITPRVPAGKGNWAAYGWNIGKSSGGAIDRVSHAGSDGVFFSYFWWNPQADLFYYLVGNSGEENVLAAVRAVRSRLLGAISEQAE